MTLEALLVHFALVTDRKHHHLILRETEAVLGEVSGPAPKDDELAAVHIDRATDERVGRQDPQRVHDERNHFRRGLRV